MKSGHLQGVSSDTSREAQGKRLKMARLKSGFNTASDAARHLDIAGPTYLAHENGTRAIKPETAKIYAEAFNVKTEYLLLNAGSLDDGNDSSVASHGETASNDPLLKEYSRLLSEMNLIWRDGELKAKVGTAPVTLPVLKDTAHLVPLLKIGEADDGRGKVRFSKSELTLSVCRLIGVDFSLLEPGQFFALRVGNSPLLPADSNDGTLVFQTNCLHKVNPSQPAIALACDHGSDRPYLVLIEADENDRLRLKKSTASNGIGLDPNAPDMPEILGIATNHAADTLASIREKLGHTHIPPSFRQAG